MMPYTLLIDMDAIVADLATDWHGLWEQKTGKKIDPDTQTSWDIGKSIGDNRIYELLKTPGLYLNLKPIPGSQAALKELFDFRINGKRVFDVNFLTASITAPHILADKAYWLKEHFPFIPPKNWAFFYKKEKVKGDFFIDDSPKNLAKFKEAQPEAVTLTIDYPYNWDAKADFRAIGHKNYEEAWKSIVFFLKTMGQWYTQVDAREARAKAGLPITATAA